MVDYFKEDRYIYIWDILMDNYFKEVMVDGSIGERILSEYI